MRRIEHWGSRSLASFMAQGKVSGRTADPVIALRGCRPFESPEAGIF
jgi:hypothetical protein